MKTPEETVVDVAQRLENTWAATLSGTSAASAWPAAFPLGEPSSTDLGADFASVTTQVATWREWATASGLRLTFRARRVLNTNQELPTHLHVPDLDTAARVTGGDWPDRLARGRQRGAILTDRYPHLANPARVLASVDKLSDVNFDLLCRSADWFARHDATGLTPRQVPIAGAHAKWLNNRHALIAELAGVENLGLAPRHPARIHFTYLDPAYRSSGARIHDSATVGDPIQLPYPPEIVVISENKDTAIHFPALSGAVSVEGVGRGGMTAAAFDWIAKGRRVFYWGDMDADGLEILNEFRAAGVQATSILMNPAAYEAWEQFGTNVDQHGKALGPRTARPVRHLNDAERSLYHQLISPTWTRHRRIEQERIPLGVALAQVDGQ